MRSPSIGAAVLGGLFGLLSGIGFGLYLQQQNVMSAQNKSDIIVPIIGLLIGVAAGLFGGRRRRTA